MTNIVTVKPIRTEADYDEAIACINTLLDMNPASGTPEDDKLDVLSTLVEVYEDKHYPTLSLDPVEAIKAAMEKATTDSDRRSLGRGLKAGRTVYHSDPAGSGLTERIEPDGRRTLGRFANRRFVPVRPTRGGRR